MTILLTNARVIDPANGLDRVMDVRIDGERIAGVGASLCAEQGDRIIDCTGRVVAPGFVDPHVHFRQPGYEQKETIGTGSAAAAAGGYTTVLCEPNTRPPRDTRSRVDEVLRIAGSDAAMRVLTKACLTAESKGLEVSQILRGEDVAGVAAASDDGNPVLSHRVMLEACRQAGRHGLVVTPHSEDSHYSNTQIAHVADAPAGLRCDFRDEAIFVARDIECARESGCRLHLAHVSLAESVDLIRQAKDAGLPVTCEGTPHHLLLTTGDEARIGQNARMNPPLRADSDRDALCSTLADGTIDCIATDHAPHTERDKAAGAMGVIGLETAFGVLNTRLVDTGCVSLPKLIDLMSAAPARIFGLPFGTLSPGSCADVVVLDPAMAWTVDAGAFRSLSRNCPFDGWPLKGLPVLTVARGRIVFELGR